MNRMTALSLLGLAACSGGGMGSAPAPAAPPATSVGAPAAGTQLSVTMGQEFPLHVGQSAAVAGVSAVITFRGVPSDSRCPSDVQCVQAGNAAVMLDVATRGGPAAPVTLNSTTPPRETALGNGILRLVSLSPSRTAAGTIEPSAYVATLCVCRQ